MSLSSLFLYFYSVKFYSLVIILMGLEAFTVDILVDVWPLILSLRNS